MEKAKIVIVLNDDGSINVTGPLNDKILCAGLIEIAKNIIINPKEEQSPSVLKLEKN